MKRVKRKLQGVTRVCATFISALASLVLPTFAHAQSDVSCIAPMGDIEEITLRILDGDTEVEILDAFSRLTEISESAVQEAFDAYVETIAEGNNPATVSMLVNDTATCVRLVVI